MGNNLLTLLAGINKNLSKLYLMKCFLVSYLFFASIILVQAQPPQGYYNPASGKSGTDLQLALHDIIKNHTAVSYATLWTSFQTTDKKPNGKVWDMYSDIPNVTPPYEYTFITQQCGSSYSGENSCYNREHSWPKSWFGGDIAPMYTDLFHIVPTDAHVNGMRGNYPYGEVGTASWTSRNGSKLGNCVTPGYSGLVFEPRDEYKGDFARNYFYMATRYYTEDASWPGSEMVTGSQFKPWAKVMLLLWAQKDPVSQKEIDRNNAVYVIQKNRNPFIDQPEYANSIWGINTGLSMETKKLTLPVYPNPASSECNITLPSSFNQQNFTFVVYSSTGMQVNAPLTVKGNTATLNLESFRPGFYLIQLTQTDSNTQFQTRIIKK